MRMPEAGKQVSKDYKSDLARMARGEAEVSQLPLSDEAFWEFVIVRAARPGRQSDRVPFLSAAAEHLLRRPLAETVESKRQEAALRSLGHGNVRVRRVALTVLGKATQPEITEGLKRAAYDRDFDVRLSAVRLLTLSSGEDVLAALADILAHTSDSRAILASDALVEEGAASIPALSGLLTSDDPRTRWRATHCLVGLNSPAALPALLASFYDDSPDIAWLAADGLLALGPEFQISILEHALSRRLSTPSMRAIRHFAEHSHPQELFRPLVIATHGLANFAAVPVAIEEALSALRLRQERITAPNH